MYTDCCKDSPDNNGDYQKVKIVAEVLSYIDAHIGEWILLKDMAESMNYSPGYFSRIFKEVTGNSLNKYMVKKKIEVAKELMRSGTSITEAAEKTGFGSYSYFYRAFIKAEGISPSEFLEREEK